MLEPTKNRDSGEKGGKRTGLEKKLFICVAILSIITSAILILYFTKRSCSISDEECTEKNCVKAAAELLEFADLKIDPCNDFYNYVCGHYIKNAVKNAASTPVLQIMSELENEMKAIVVDPIRKKDTKANVAMKQFYQACMNEAKLDADKDQTFLNTTKELGGWPLIEGTNWEGANFDWVQWHLKSVKLGVPVIGFFSFRIGEVSKNNTVLRVSGSKIANVVITMSEYESLMEEIAEVFDAPNGFGSENIEVYDFLRKLKKLTGGIQEERDRYEHISKVEDLYHKCPQFPWIEMLNELSGGSPEFKNDSEVIFGTMKAYCNGLDKLLEETPNRVIANYFVWSIIHETHNFMSRYVRKAYEDLKETTEDRFKTCYALTDKRFQYLKETVYIRRKTKPEVRNQLDELVELVKEVFIEHIEVSNWMDEETKRKAVERTKLLEKVIGAHEVLYDVETFDRILGVDGLELSSDNAYQIIKEKNIRENEHVWEMTYSPKQENWKEFFHQASAVNAFFSQPLNMMIIAAPILNTVYFNHKMPAFMNYGSIGRVVAHEIMHGFGEEGRYILENNKRVDWWTNETAEAFRRTRQCVIDEYERIPFRYKLNGILTLEENLADFVGIDIAYEAYLKWVEKHGEEKKLPGVPLTTKQIFWLQTGTSLCFRKLDDVEVDMDAENEHAFPAFRVTGGAKNSLYFAEDFNCPEGAYMNPKEKCRIL